jgi:hypothetical protein
LAPVVAVVDGTAVLDDIVVVVERTVVVVSGEISTTCPAVRSDVVDEIVAVSVTPTETIGFDDDVEND